MSSVITNVFSILKGFIGFTRNFEKVEDAKADRFIRIGQKICIKERGSAKFDVIEFNVNHDDFSFIKNQEKNTSFELILKGDTLHPVQFGLIVNDASYDSLPVLNAINLIARAAQTRERKKIRLPTGSVYVSDTFELEREVIYEGSGAKVTTFSPHSSWDNATLKWVVADAVLGTPNGTADNNFFGVRLNFGVRNDNSVSNLGCFWARSGGGSQYENLYLADAFGGETLRVSGKPPSEGGDGGAVVATSFKNIWLATTGANPTTGSSGSRARNGLLCDNVYSTSFYGLVVDYQSNDTDYLDDINDTDGFGVKISNSQVNFYGINMEGNHKPVFSDSAQHCAFYGGSVYRKGLGSQTPVNEQDYIFRNTSVASMPSVYNFYAAQGYIGVAITIGSTVGYEIKTRGDIGLTSGGGFSYLNENPVNIKKIVPLGEIEHPIELAMGKSSVITTPLSRGFKGVIRTEFSEVVAMGSGFIDIPLNGHGRLTILAARSDSSNSNKGDVIEALYSAEGGPGTVLKIGEIMDPSPTLNFITGLAVADKGGGVSALRVSYNSTVYNFNLSVMFSGRTSTGV